MGKLGKFAVCGVALVGLVSAFQSIGRDVEADFAEMNAEPSAAEEQANSLEPFEPLAVASAPASEPARVGSSILEQAIFDTFSHERHRSPKQQREWRNAVDFLSVAFISKGHLCAVPVEAQKASPDLYGIGCITRRDGTGKSNYLLNIRTGEVTPI